MFVSAKKAKFMSAFENKRIPLRVKKIFFELKIPVSKKTAEKKMRSSDEKRKKPFTETGYLLKIYHIETKEYKTEITEKTVARAMLQFLNFDIKIILFILTE